MRTTLIICGLMLVGTTAQAQTAKPPAADSVDAVVSKVNRHVTNLERQMAREEARLQARMKQIAQMRKSALAKEDSKALKAIETMEAQAFKTYEARMRHIISQLEGDPTKASSNSSNRRSNRSTRSNSNSSRNQRKTKQGSVSSRSRYSKGYQR